MASGSFTGTTNNDNVQPKITWSATKDANGGNFSVVSATLTYSRTNSGYSTNGTWSGSITINGDKKTGSKSITITQNSNTEAITHSITVYHNDDGKKSITISATGGIPGTSMTSTTISKTVALDNIPRYAKITSAPAFDDTQNPTIYYSNGAGNNVATLQACIAKTDGYTILVPYRDISKTGTSYTFSLTTAERQALQNACNTANSINVRFYVKTIIGSNTYFHYETRLLTIKDAAPTIAPTAIEHQDADGVLNTQSTGSNTRWIKGYSDVAWAFNPTYKKGAYLKSCSVECGSQTDSNTISGVFSNVASGTVKFTLIDSRGNSVSQTLTRTLIDYVKPSINLKVSGALDTETTTKMTINISGQYFSGNLLASAANTLTVQYRYKASGGSWGSWTAASPTKGTNSYSFNTTVGGFDYQKTYIFQAQVQDRQYNIHGQWIQSNEVSITVKPVFSWDKDDFTFNVQTFANAGDVGFLHTHDKSGARMGFGVGGGGVNRGIYDYTHEKWLFHNDGTDTHIANSTNDFIYGKNKILATPGLYMNGDQTVNLNEPISSQPHGIVLVFSRYTPGTTGTNGTIHDHNFSYHFVPKGMISMLHNGGSVFAMNTTLQELYATKYLYFTDTTIKGNDQNSQSGTGANGIKYSNNMYILRYVIGV